MERAYVRAGEAGTFAYSFERLTGFAPFRWQERLFARFVAGDLPAALDLLTGLGKTSVMAIWLLARGENSRLIRGLVCILQDTAILCRVFQKQIPALFCFHGGYFYTLTSRGDCRRLRMNAEC